MDVKALGQKKAFSAHAFACMRARVCVCVCGWFLQIWGAPSPLCRNSSTTRSCLGAAIVLAGKAYHSFGQKIFAHTGTRQHTGMTAHWNAHWSNNTLQHTGTHTGTRQHSAKEHAPFRPKLNHSSPQSRKAAYHPDLLYLWPSESVSAASPHLTIPHWTKSQLSTLKLTAFNFTYPIHPHLQFRRTYPASDRPHVLEHCHTLCLAEFLKQLLLLPSPTPALQWWGRWFFSLSSAPAPPSPSSSHGAPAVSLFLLVLLLPLLLLYLLSCFFALWLTLSSLPLLYTK